MKLCWNAAYGPIPANAEVRAWRVVHVLSREALDCVFYVDDETGEVWRFAEDSMGRIALSEPDSSGNQNPVIEKLVLGPGTIRLERIPIA